MDGLIKYRVMQFRYCARRIEYKLGKSEYLPKDSLSREAFNAYIVQAINSGLPLMVARFGSQEARALAWAHGVRCGYDRAIPGYVQKRMALGPGFFPSNDQNIRRFGDVMTRSASSLDALAYWDSFMQQYLLETLCPKKVVTSYLENLEPYRNQANPWSSALAGKRVLVVHPFAKTIESQYKQREKLFNSDLVLPEFDLNTLVPPQTIAGTSDSRFSDWFEALDYLKSAVSQIDFDVAIIGCGAYGFPLASYVKDLGRQAIHLGGATQMLFGIKGKRWDLKSISDELYNEAWVRPSEDEMPDNAMMVEDGCYW